MANQYETLANARQKGIEKYLWNDQQGWYADYDLKSHKVRNQLTAAALFPLYVNAAAKDRANKMATATKTHLLQPGGLNTTSVNSGINPTAGHRYSGSRQKDYKTTGKKRWRWTLAGTS